MRCERCGYSSPENHKFCGMCGARLSQAASSVAVDDSDPLDIETPAPEPLQFRELDRRREFARDAARSSGPNGSRNYTSATVANLPPDTAEEAIVEEARNRKSKDRPTGIGGPSFLGLGYEGTNDGFVYDKPDDGFVYDTDVPPPEYLLEEIPRGVSWRAWALFLLLLIGAGLGYVQWRASHNLGFPDVASILARNGPTVDPSGPDMRDNNGKPSPKAQAPAADSSKTDSAKDSAEKASASNGGEAQASSESEAPAASKEAAESKNASATDKTSKTDKTAKSDENTADATPSSKSAKVAATKTSEEHGEEAAKPESDGPVGKATKANRIPPQPEEEAPQSKSLGEKDPLIVKANKYLRAKGARRNCSAAVNLLREASSAGNPSADVKMGALYWSGTCVTQSNVVAYQWFARAHALEPNNRWIERSRTSLWARLTPAERRRVGY